MRLPFAFIACTALVACSDPIADFPRLADQDIPENASSVEAVASAQAQSGGLLAQLMGTDNAPAEPVADETQAEDNTPATGLLALFTRKPAQPADDVTLASLPAEPAPAKPVLPKQQAISEIEPGVVLPYGKVARICGLAKRQLGKKIAQHPEKNPVHKIYDSDPGNTAPHSFFITGFDDGCARQFTASVAMFGSVAMHEQLRYGLPSEVQPYSDTDKAYEKLKSRICGVARKKPCGSKLSRMDRTTVFVSIYERFGSNPQWTNLLLHDGEVIAQDHKGG